MAISFPFSIKSVIIDRVRRGKGGKHWSGEIVSVPTGLADGMSERYIESEIERIKRSMSSHPDVYCSSTLI